MVARGRTCAGRAAALLSAGALVALATGCGEDAFERRPRPPAAVQLTGVIQPDRVTLSPSAVGAGAVTITVSNQTDYPHTLTLAGGSVEERVGPINPLDTAQIQQTLLPGVYELRAGSPVALPRRVLPAELRIGPERARSNDRLLLP